MGNKHAKSSAEVQETQSLDGSPNLSKKERKPAKRTLSFGDKPRNKWKGNKESKDQAKTGSAGGDIDANIGYAS